VPAAAPPRPAVTRSCAVVHSAAVTALAVDEAGMLGVTVGLRLGVSVGLGPIDGGDGVAGDCEVTIEAGGDAWGVLEPPVQPLTATTELSTQTWTSRRTARA